MSGPIIEIVDAGDRFADYCLWDYPPLTEPRGKLRSCSLLWFFLDHLGWADARNVSEILRAALDPFQTVWGIKRRPEGYSLEFYFYDYARLQRRLSIERVLSALAPRLSSGFPRLDRRPYFMFSIEITRGTVASGRIEDLTLYIGNPGSSVSSGISYKVTRRSSTLDNLYYFFDRRSQVEDIRAKVACSAYHDLGAAPLGAVLWPDLLTCQTIVVANKQRNDGVYFSRLPYEGFSRFLGQTGFPVAFTSFVAQHRDRLDHLLYDVGFDYVPAAGGIQVIKSAFYGLL